jgi:hypothetical protein
LIYLSPPTTDLSFSVSRLDLLASVSSAAESGRD